MPPSTINSSLVLSVIAQEVSLQSNTPIQMLLCDYELLDTCLQSIKRFNWEAVAKAACLKKHQIYRWYYDNHQRNLKGNVTLEDMKIIRQELVKAIQLGVPTNVPFQKLLKEKLSREYQRNSFTVAFNNSKRLVSTGLRNKINESETTDDKEMKRRIQDTSYTSYSSIFTVPDVSCVRHNYTDIFEDIDNQKSFDE
ncbi:Conserved_hypothetical protein [Hexamita inflata]|uniref:Uncharacterized protein n=1 Tax=Hexamita inflata TaxID=28002 RepID=A0AA86QAI0_9EUKA|nr:Conserved hypothetical protein [Hexamita inflata]